jgi:hypothetical protein
MKTINFPQPVHEQAVEILEEAKKKLEGLGYKSGFTASVECPDVMPLQVPAPTGCETHTVKPCAVFQLSLGAAIEL